MEKIKILTFNLNGIADAVKRNIAFAAILKEKPQIALLTETHCPPQNVQKYSEEWKQLGGGEAFFAPSDNTRTMGVAILFGKDFKPKLHNTKISIPGRLLAVEIDINHQKNKIIACYAPAGNS